MVSVVLLDWILWYLITTGIGLYTHHKYRKSIESAVPLDAHGNPVTAVAEEIDRTSQSEETIRLISSHGDDVDLLAQVR